VARRARSGGPTRSRETSVRRGKIRAGILVPVTVDVPFADRVSTQVARRNVVLGEGIREILKLPSGRFEVPWIPDRATLRFVRAYVMVPVGASGFSFRSPALLPGDYTVLLAGQYVSTTIVTVGEGKSVDLSGCRDALQSAISEKRMNAERGRHRRRSCGALEDRALGYGPPAAAGFGLAPILWTAVSIRSSFSRRSGKRPSRL
jgi:hypothetical protein